MKGINLAVKISGNPGAQQAISVSIKVSKEILLFQQEFPIFQCDVKNYLIGQSGVGEKNSTPTPSFVRNSTPPP